MNHFLTGTAAYDKLKSLLTSKLLLGDIKKLSPDAQTSCLEGFHATLNHWHPKMIGFSWLGSFCRYCNVVWGALHVCAYLHINSIPFLQPSFDTINYLLFEY